MILKRMAIAFTIFYKCQLIPFHNEWSTETNLTPARTVSFYFLVRFTNQKRIETFLVINAKFSIFFDKKIFGFGKVVVEGLFIDKTVVVLQFNFFY